MRFDKKSKKWLDDDGEVISDKEIESELKTVTLWTVSDVAFVLDADGRISLDSDYYEQRLTDGQVFALYDCLAKWIQKKWANGSAIRKQCEIEEHSNGTHTMKDPKIGPICLQCNGAGIIYSDIDLPSKMCDHCKGVGRLALWVGKAREEKGGA